jgi:hypothetical protein
MTNYAFMDSENVVVHLLIGPEEGLESFYESMDQFKEWTCKQVVNGAQDTHDGTFVAVDYTYDAVNDVFVAPPAPEVEVEP